MLIWLASLFASSDINICGKTWVQLYFHVHASHFLNHGLFVRSIIIHLCSSAYILEGKIWKKFS